MTKKEFKYKLLKALRMWKNGDVFGAAILLNLLATHIVAELEAELKAEYD